MTKKTGGHNGRKTSEGYPGKNPVGDRLEGERASGRGNRSAGGAVDYRRQADKTRTGKAGVVQRSGWKPEDREGQSSDLVRSGQGDHEHQEGGPVFGDESGPSGRSAPAGDVPRRPPGRTGRETPGRNGPGTRRGRSHPGGEVLINPALAGLAVPIETLTPDPENARIHDDRNIALIMESLTRYGQQTPLVVRGGVVLKGNATLEAAKRLGWREIAAIPFHQKTGVRGYKLVDNRAAELAAWGPILGGELQKLMDDGEDMGALGWNKDELEPYFREEAEAKDVIPKVPKVAVTKLGDVIKLGRHILFCGVSTDPDTPVRLAPYGPAALIFTSPPYWVGMPYEYQENVKEIDEF